MDQMIKEFIKYLDDCIKEYKLWGQSALVEEDNDNAETYPFSQVCSIQYRDTVAIKDHFKSLVKKYNL